MTIDTQTTFLKNDDNGTIVKEEEKYEKTEGERIDESISLWIFTPLFFIFVFLFILINGMLYLEKKN